MLLISKRQCECGTPLGSASTPGQWNADSYAHDLRRLKKRGWSEHKIERWLEAKQSSHAKLERLAHERADGPSAEPVESWLGFLENAPECGVGRIGLRVCHGDDSWSATSPHATLRMTEVTAPDLRAMEENTLYVFVP